MLIFSFVIKHSQQKQRQLSSICSPDIYILIGEAFLAFFYVDNKKQVIPFSLIFTY